MDSLQVQVKDGQGNHYLVTNQPPKALPKHNKPLESQAVAAFLKSILPLGQKTLKSAIGEPNDQKLVKALHTRYKVFKLSESEKRAISDEKNNAHASNGSTGDKSSSGNEKPDSLDKYVVGTESKNSSGYQHSTSAKSTSATSKTTTGAEENQSSDTPATKDTPCSGDPISMVSGEELLPLTDFSLPGPISFIWERTYRTSNPDNYGLGHGWTHPLCERLNIEGRYIHYYTNEGRSIRFVQPKIGEARRNRSENLTLSRQSEHSYALISPTGPKRLFRADGIHKHLPLVELRDGFNNSISIDYQQGQPRKLVTSWGRLLEFVCDDAGNITHIHAPQSTTSDELSDSLLAQYTYSDDNDLIAANNHAGQSEQYQYDNHIILQRTTTSGVNFLFEWDQHTPEARCQRQWSDNGAYDYHFKWQPKRKISYSTDSNGKTHEYHFNESGKAIKEIDPEGGVTKRLYDTYGNLCSESNPNGHTTYYRYDQLGNVTRITDALNNTTRIRYNDFGLPTLITDAQGNHWQRRYNNQGLLSEIRDPGGNIWRYSYNDKGQLEALQDPEGGKRLLHWNSQFELLSETNADGSITEYGYDHWGRVNRITDAGGHETRYRYDSAGRVTQVTDPEGKSSQLRYNSAGQVTHHTDNDGRITEYQYGGFSQVQCRIDPNGQKFEYHYDQERNLIGLTNEKGEQYQLKYDGNERLTEEIGFDGRHQHYRYNPAGHLIEHRDMDVVTQFTRDPLGRLLRKTNNSGDVAEFHYDSLGRLTAANNNDAFVRYQYDQSGRLLAENSDVDNPQSKQNNSHSLQHKYDKRGWRTATSSNDQHISYQYTPGGQLYGVDHNGKPVVRCEYDATGRLTEKVQGGLTSRFDYDPAGRLIQQQVNNKATDNPVIQRDYKYNSAGNLQQIEDLLRGLTHYHYDSNDQLTQVDGAVKEAFSFDPAGNLLQNSDGQAGYDQGNRLRFHADRHFSYDKRGNLVEERRGKNQSLSANYQYNGWNQLISVEKDGFKTHYRYDALGRRISKVVTHLKSKQQKKTSFRWNGDVLWSETNHTPKGTQSQHYLFEPNSFRPLALIKDDEIHHYHLDHLGTPQEITNELGEIVWQAQYKAYGQLAGFADKPGISNPLRFQGQYFDGETGLHYNRHRYYDPSVGRFTNQDPVGLLGGNNCYQYAPNPTGWVDPFGLTCKEGTATVHLWKTENGDKHISIETVHGGKTLHTHQVHDGNRDLSINDGQMHTWILNLANSGTKQLVDSVTITLPNSAAAQEYQLSILTNPDKNIWKEMGWYDASQNSCMSHACDVLMAGGIDTKRNENSTGRSTREGQRLLMKEKSKQAT